MVWLTLSFQAIQSSMPAFICSGVDDCICCRAETVELKRTRYLGIGFRLVCDKGSVSAPPTWCLGLQDRKSIPFSVHGRNPQANPGNHLGLEGVLTFLIHPPEDFSPSFLHPLHRGVNILNPNNHRWALTKGTFRFSSEPPTNYPFVLNH